MLHFYACMLKAVLSFVRSINQMELLIIIDSLYSSWFLQIKGLNYSKFRIFYLLKRCSKDSIKLEGVSLRENEIQKTYISLIKDSNFFS